MRRTNVSLLLLAAACSEPGSFEVRMAWGPAGPPAEREATVFAEVVELAAEGASLEGARVLAQAAPVRVAAVVARTAEVLFTAVPNGPRRVVVVEVRDGEARSAELVRYGVSAPFALVEGEKQVIEVTAGLLPPPGPGPAGQAIAVEGFAAEAQVFLPSAAAPLVLTTDSGARAELSGFQTFPEDRTLCLGLGAADSACADRALKGVALPRNPACTRKAGTDTPCEYAIVWDLNTGLEDDCGLDPTSGHARSDACPRAVFVRFFDANGVASKIYDRSIVLDTLQPSLQRAALSYLPGPGNPLPTPRAAAPGTELRLELSLSEPVITPPEELSAEGPGGARLILTRSAYVEGGLELTYAATLAAPSPASGTYVLSLNLIDRAGNDAPLAGALAPIEVRGEKPTLIVDQSQISYLRAPVMRTEPEPLGRYTLPAGPSYYALGPADPLDDLPSLARDVLRLAGEPAAGLRVWADGARQISIAPLVRPAADGSWDRASLELPEVDVPRVYVSGLDAAGNESDAVMIENIWFVGSSAELAGEESPHQLSRSSLAEYPRAPQTPIEGGAATSTPDGLGVRRGPSIAWRTYGGQAPDPFPGGAIWDETRGEVFFTEYLSRAGIYAWDGLGFADRTPGVGNVEGRQITAIAFDRARGRAVAFPSNTSETWIWDGLSWTLAMTSTAPSPRSTPAMAYDSAREVVVLFGGLSADPSRDVLSDTWTWDGSDWTHHRVSGPRRNGHSIAYDPASRRVLLFGGHTSSAELNAGLLAPAETWAWDGARWTNLSPADPNPSPRQGAIMAYDEARGRVVLAGVQTAFFDPVPDTWEWDGSRWHQAAAIGALGSGAGAYDGRRGQLIAWGGRDFDEVFTEPKVFAWDGQSWSSASVMLRPPVSVSELMFHDPLRGISVVLEPPIELGAAWGIWRFDGRAWSVTSTSGPVHVPFEGWLACAHDVGRDRTVVLSVQSSGAETWLFDGERFIPTATSAPHRAYASIVYDAARGQVLMVGGVDTGGVLRDDTFVWNGSAWIDTAHAGPRPAPRVGAAIGYDAERERVVMFQGYVDSGRGDGSSVGAGDLWEWDGASWTERTPASGGPPAESELKAYYDPELQRLVVQNFGLEATAWTWDGQAWAELSEPEVRYLGGPYNLIYETARRSALFVGGDEFQTTYFMRRVERIVPAIQLAVSLPADLPVDAIADLRVRGACGGKARSSTGARLVGWSRGPAKSEWVTLDANSADLGAADLDFRSADRSGETARRLVIEGDRAIYLQCRADTDAEVESSEVMLDYLEARVKFQVNTEDR